MIAERQEVGSKGGGVHETHVGKIQADHVWSDSILLESIDEDLLMSDVLCITLMACWNNPKLR